MTATVGHPRVSLHEQQHIVLDEISWEFYEQLLREIGDRPIRVTFDEGSIEIMSPLPKHEWVKKAIARLLELMALELEIPLESFGSTTFRRRDKQKGLEPDECCYLQNAGRVRDMEEFDPKRHPAPDLAIEIDITARSIPREPIYAALSVPEIWRFDGEHIHILQLEQEGKYREVNTSRSFPFLPIRNFEKFVQRMRSAEQTAVLREFRDWVKTLPRS